MTLQEIRESLERGAKVRMPRLTPDAGVRERIEQLEDYLNLTAVVRGELEEARLWANLALKQLVDDWDTIKGWGLHLPGNGRHTKDDVIKAKAEIRPDLHDSIKEARWLIDRLSEQLDRLGSRMGDDQVASRLYTMLTAG